MGSYFVPTFCFTAGPGGMQIDARGEGFCLPVLETDMGC